MVSPNNKKPRLKKHSMSTSTATQTSTQPHRGNPTNNGGFRNNGSQRHVHSRQYGGGAVRHSITHRGGKDLWKR